MSQLHTYEMVEQRSALREESAHDSRARLLSMVEASIPGVESKLLRCGLADSDEAALRLTREVRRYLALCELRPDLALPMFSTRVDEAWHQTVLFTEEYIAFCERWFGHYVHHRPRESAPAAASGAPAQVSSFEEFKYAYEQVFGALADEWYDERFLAPTTRLSWAKEIVPVAAVEGARAVLRNEQRDGMLLCRVDARLAGALRFIAGHAVFLVREVPAPTEEAQLALCRPLVRFRLLQVSP